MSYVLIHHGWTNTRQTDHWQHHLALALRAQGHQVSYAQYPETQLPNYAAWSELLVAELELLVEQRELARRGISATANAGKGEAAELDDELVLVGHSLGCVNIMKNALEGTIRPELRANRTLFVAPAALRTLGQVSSFQFELETAEHEHALHEAVRTNVGTVQLVASDKDPWLPLGIGAAYGNALKTEAVIIEGAGHLALADGWGKWQGVIDWVNNPAADLRQR